MQFGDNQCSGVWYLAAGLCGPDVCPDIFEASRHCGRKLWKADCAQRGFTVSVTPRGMKMVRASTRRKRLRTLSPQLAFETWIRMLHRTTPRGFRPVGVVQGRVVGG